MAIPFIDLKSQFKKLELQIRQKIDAVLEHGNFIMGPEIKELEKALASFVGVKHCVSCASGTDALLMALMAKGVGPGDVVFTTPFTFIATAEVISLLGATPVFVDIEERTFDLDPNKLDLAIQAVKSGDASLHPLPSSTSLLTPRAIITVDLFGLPCDYDRINAIAKKHELFVIEDAAQSFGAEYKGKKACALAEIACTSFFPAKPLGCYGDGGAVFTNDDGIAEILASIRVHGKGGHKYDNVRIGLNGRLDTLQAAILLPKLDAFPWELGERRRVAAAYTQLLSSHPSIITPHVPENYTSAWAQYSILAKSSQDRDFLTTKLKAAGVPTAIYYPKSLHLQPAYAHLGYKPGDFPVSEDASARIFSLPMHPYLEEKTIDHITTSFKAN